MGYGYIKSGCLNSSAINVKLFHYYPILSFHCKLKTAKNVIECQIHSFDIYFTKVPSQKMSPQPSLSLVYCEQVVTGDWFMYTCILLKNFAILLPRV